MKSRSVALFILLASVPMLAQTTTPTRKPTKSHTASKPVSGYMRRVGLLYLETIDDFEKECGYEGRENHTCNSDRWDSTFSSLEDRVEISLSESHSAGDKPFWSLLKNAKMSTQIFLSTQRTCLVGKTASPSLREALDLQQALHGGGTEWSPETACKQEETYLKVYPICRSYAHSIAVDGTYASDGGCSTKFNSAVEADSHPAPAKPKPASDLK